MGNEPRLVCVRKCQGIETGNIYKSKLDAAGIPSLLQYESAGLVYGITVDGLGEVRIMVPQEFADDAKHLLEELQDEESEDLFGDEEFAAS